MIALYGIPGSRNFAFKRVFTNAEGLAWIAWIHKRSLPETQESLNSLRQSSVISNREAAKLRWNDGSKIVKPIDEFGPAEGEDR